MKKNKSFLLSLIIMTLFLFSIMDVFADACPLSSTGNFVNGEQMTQRDLYQGDQVQIGDSRIII
ncbi:hypothetical protein LLG10_06820 [bacterium]|nr:hypothetical protein [bacterium]